MPEVLERTGKPRRHLLCSRSINFPHTHPNQRGTLTKQYCSYIKPMHYVLTYSSWSTDDTGSQKSCKRYSRPSGAASLCHCSSCCRRLGRRDERCCPSRLDVSVGRGRRRR